jgi:hypothetical protein
MKARVIFENVSDMDTFYNKFVSEISDESVSVAASLSDSTATVSVRDSDFETEKNIINSIKQYMRDENINYKIEV